MADHQAVHLGWSTRAAILILCLLATLAALWVSRPVSAPLLLAFVVAIVLGPIQDRMCAAGVPRGVAAGFILATLIGGGGAILLAAEPVLWRIWDEVPRIRWEIRSLLWDLRSTLQGLEEINRELLGGATGNAEEGGAAGAGMALPSAVDAALLAPRIIGQALIFVGTLYFALTGRQTVYATITSGFGGAPLRARIDAAERRVARYFGTITLINAGLGVAVAVGLGLIGLPLAAVWGVFAALMNFALYIGPAIVAVSLLLAGLINFEGVMIFAPSALFLVINGIEAQFVTPSMVGRNMRLNPLFVFLSIVLWLWLWGPVGGVVAIPVLVFALALNETRVLRGEHLQDGTP